MAKHLKENILHGQDHSDGHVSDNRWRHQESSAFARHAALGAAPKKVREADSHNDVSDLADFLNKSRIEPSGAGAAVGTHQPIVVDRPKAGGGGAGTQSATGVSWGGNIDVDAGRTDGREVRCGPLINYRGMEGSMWCGSVLIVTRGGSQEGDFEPELKLRRAESISNGAPGLGYTLRSIDVNGVDGVDGDANSREPRS